MKSKYQYEEDSHIENLILLTVKKVNIQKLIPKKYIYRGDDNLMSKKVYIKGGFWIRFKQ